MKSHLLSRRDLTAIDEFKKDIGILCGLPRQVLTQLPATAIEALEAPTEGESDRVREAAAERLSVPLSKLGHALSVPTYLLRQFAPKGDAENDSPSDIADDLVELGVVPKEKAADVSAMFEATKGLSRGKLEMILLRKAHSRAVLPVLGSVSTVVDFRVLFDQNYKYEEDVGSYQPKFMGTIPLGIVEIELQGAHQEEVFFQVTKRTLQVMLDTLSALQKQIAVAEERLGS